MNYRGELVVAPRDFSCVVASYQDGVIVWSRSGKSNHQVRYGLQLKTFKDDLSAAREFGECVRHLAECDGLL